MPNWAALPSQGQQWVDDIQRAGQAEGVDPYLLAALVWAESTFNPTAGSSAGAYGLAQLMPGTAAGMGINSHDPYQNLLGGARYLSQQLDRFGRVDYALAAYNAGPGRVAQSGGIPNITETENYVRKVLEYWRALGGGGSGTYDANANAMAPGTAVSKVPKIPQMSGGTVAGRLLDAMVAKKQGMAGGPVTPQQVVPEGKLPAGPAGAVEKQGLREIGITQPLGEIDEESFKALRDFVSSHREDVAVEEEEAAAAPAEEEKAASTGEIQRPAGMNGRLPAELLTDIGGGFQLQTAAAQSWLQMVAAMAAAGVSYGISSAYRTYEHQARLYAELGDYSQGGLAAPPGRSPHGWGIALDVSGGAAQRWLAANASRYGWHTVAREPWHWQFGRTNG